ncbi:MAG: hypothetical protein K0R01_2947, partial [Mycobacterium sp.]|nr:hypothetical protein [Mycobacterium sp.]
MVNITDLSTLVRESAGRYVERGAAELHYARKMFEAG